MVKKTEHDVFLETLDTCKRCNKCAFLNFKSKTCTFDKKNPIFLNTAETDRGYIVFLRPNECRFKGAE